MKEQYLFDEPLLRGTRWQTPGCPRLRYRVISVPTVCLVAVFHIEILYRRHTPSEPAVAALFIRKSIDMNFICYHKCGVESKTEMTDDLIIVCLVFVFFQEIQLHRKMQSG